VKRDNSKDNAVTIDINIAQLLKQPTGSGREYDIQESIRGIDPLLDPVGPLSAHVKLVRTKSGVLLSFSGKSSLRTPCSRCLEPATMPVSLSFEEEFLQTVDVASGLPLGTSQDDPAVLIDEHHDLHLAGLVREYLLLALPMHPLCREDCKGLCPQCGHNLNSGPCSCHVEPVDERWAALKGLLDK